MPKHIITRSYNNLKGFSTDSIFLRPPNVSEKAFNIHRQPDGTYSPRRGFQCQTADIGGLGMDSFDNPCRCGTELVCVHRDGNLYRRITEEINIEFTTASATAWFQFNIFTNPNIYNNPPGWGFSPWSLTPWSSPSGESITFNGFLKSSAIVVGDQTNVTTINVQAGHIVQVGSIIAVSSQERDNAIESRLVTAIAATTITFSGGPLSVVNNDRIDIFIEQLFLKGYDVISPYPISQFLTVLNAIPGVIAFTTGNTTYPAAFIPIQENTTLTSGNSTTIEYFYWELINSPIDPILPGSANAFNQNSANFENASFCVFDEILYCTNGYDPVIKYDGQNAYLSGMPKGDRPNITDGGVGNLDAGDYLYAITYEQKDNATHLIEGVISDSILFTIAANRLNNVIVTDLFSNSGYNTNGALATGAADVIYGPDGRGFYYHRITVTPGQTFINGDTAYYLDRAIAMVVGAPAGTTTRLPVNPGYGVLIGDTIMFVDAGGILRKRVVVDIDTAGATDLLEISGSAVDVSNNPTISAYVEDDVYGHIAIVQGDQSNTTSVTVLVGHDIAVGDVIYFFDSSEEFVTREVTAIAANSVSFLYPVSILDGSLISSDSIDANLITLKTNKASAIVQNAGDPLSNNLRINIYRTQADLTQLALVASIPNNSFSATQTYVDNLIDAELQSQVRFADPLQLPNPPPKCKYILTYQNMVIYAGGSRDGSSPEISLDSFYFSKGDEPEAVPEATNFGLVPSNDDIISGLGISGSSLIIGKDRSIYAISGDLLTSQYQVLPVAPGSNIGVAAHATMKAVGNLLYFVHTNGLYSLSESQMFPTDPFGDPIPLSKPIDVLFREKPFDKNKQFVFKRAVAINYTKDNEYWLFLPCENQGGTLRNANSNSRVLCFDYMDKNWFEWSNINAAGGFATLGDDVFWQERRLSGFVGNTANTYRQHRNYRLIDYADHTQPIPVFWSSSWEDLQYPQVRKKFIRCMLLLDRVDSLYQLNQPFLTFSSYLNRFPNLKDTIAPITTVNNSVQWGSAWSWQKWSGVVDSFIRINLRNGTTAKSMQISLEMKQMNTSFRYQGFQLEISPEYDKTFVR